MNFPSCSKIQIETTNICNYNCAICPRLKLKVPLKHMSLDVFKRILNNCSDIKNVDLTGWGEPLTNPRLFDFIKLLKDKGSYVSFTTNASLLDKATIQKLNKLKVDEIAISLDGNEGSDDAGHEASKIKNTLGLIGRLSPTFRLRIQTTLTGQNLSELISIGNTAIASGASEWRLIRFDQRFQKKKTVVDEKATYAGLRRKFNKQIVVSMAQYSIYNDFRDILYRSFQILRPNQCPKLLNAAYVNVDGFLTPCCSLPHYKIGDLKTTPLKELWKSSEFSKFRKNDKKYCHSCQVLTR